MQIYNTLTRSLEELQPLGGDNKIRMYTCGPTVYNVAHIGNFRAYVFEDLLRRYLQFRGFAVEQVQNLTDVDDKTIRGALEARVALDDYTRQYKEAFFDDLKTLNIEPAEHYPAATDHIPEMIELISRLFERGLAYRSDDGSVYFRISAFPAYGKLAHLDMDGLQAGARVAHDEYEKENIGDFALWKAWSEDDGDVAWDSPWGRGRPGWHIECSAMSMKYLGESFEIHTGGIDNIFPHHEDEIAQAEGATGKPFVRYWMHCAHLVVDGRKMSKSLGNFYTLRDVLERGYSGREIRYVLAACHYRQSLNFTFASLDGARAALQRLDGFRERLEKAAGAAECPDQVVPVWADVYVQRFINAMDDDLNISDALAALFDMVHEGNRRMDSGSLEGDAAALLAKWGSFDRVLGFLQSEKAAVPDNILELAEGRQAARLAKNWGEADRLRDELATAGWEVKDTPAGPELKRRV